MLKSLSCPGWAWTLPPPALASQGAGCHLQGFLFCSLSESLVISLIVFIVLHLAMPSSLSNSELRYHNCSVHPAAWVLHRHLHHKLSKTDPQRSKQKNRTLILREDPSPNTWLLHSPLAHMDMSPFLSAVDRVVSLVSS